MKDFGNVLKARALAPGAVLVAVLCTLALMAALPLTARAETVASGDCGTSLTWALDDQGCLSIEGTGSMTNWSSSSPAPWYSERDSVKSLSISSGATSIGNHAFSDCASLTSASIPSSVTYVGYNAFSSCTSLASVSIPASVTSISYATFFGCTSLTSMSIPSSVATIGGCAFQGCTSLTSMSVPASVTYIGSGAFSGCTSLASFSIAEGNSSYRTDGRAVFDGANALIAYANASGTSYAILTSVSAIGNYAFQGCTSLTSVSIPVSVSSIGSEAFSGTSLTSVSIPSSVASLSVGAFQNCASLVSVSIPSSVASIGKGAFSGCTALADVYYGGSEENRSSMTVGASNEPLVNAAWQYNQPSLKPHDAFTDLPADAWFLQPSAAFSDGTLYIDFVLERGIMSGYADTTHFGPYDPLKRAQFATMLYRYACTMDSSLEGKYGSTTVKAKFAASNATDLPDVEAGQYYTAAVNWAVENGIITGYSSSHTFGPDEFISREQLCTMVRRFCVEYLGYADAQASLDFNDADAISDWAAAGVSYCKAKGVVSGVGDTGNFDPQGDAQRCAAAKMVAIMVHDIVEKESPIDTATLE